MKKILLFLLIYLSSLSFLFSDNSEKEFIESSSCFLVQKNRYNNFTLNFCSNFYSNNVVFFIYDDIQDDVIYKKIFYASKELLNDVFYCSGYYIKHRQNQIKYLKDTQSTILIADFTYDGDDEYLELSLADTDYCISIFKLFDEDYDDVIYEYHSINSIVYRNNNLTEIIEDIYINGLKFCIINEKRGITLKQYKMQNNQYISKLSFFYWSPTEQRYILDETVTQEQLKNAYCPEEYFAYNGLDFSKLDNRLNQSDIKDLTPAQLRLMRNAIYARHGRTFKSVDLQSLWECYTWYKKNPNYSDSLLTDIDKYNIELIQKYESK